MKCDWEMLVTGNMGLVYMVARRYVSAANELEDMVSLGKIGLVKAAKGYDEKRGIKFSTYAVYFIQGEITSFLRDDGLIKVSRELRKNRSLLDSLRRQYVAQHGFEPTISEFAKLSGLSEETVMEALSCRMQVANLEEAYTAQDERQLELQEALLDKIDLRRMVAMLPRIEQKLIVLRYFRNYSQSQTARLLNLSQSKVSRMEQMILQKMREKQEHDG